MTPYGHTAPPTDRQSGAEFLGTGPFQSAQWTRERAVGIRQACLLQIVRFIPNLTDIEAEDLAREMDQLT